MLPVENYFEFSSLEEVMYGHSYFCSSKIMGLKVWKSLKKVSYEMNNKSWEDAFDRIFIIFVNN